MYGQLDSRKLNKSDAPYNRSVKTNNVQCNAQQKMRQLSLVLKNNLTRYAQLLAWLSIKPFLAIFCPVYSRTVVFVRLTYYYY